MDVAFFVVYSRKKSTTDEDIESVPYSIKIFGNNILYVYVFDYYSFNKGSIWGPLGKIRIEESD